MADAHYNPEVHGVSYDPQLRARAHRAMGQVRRVMHDVEGGAFSGGRYVDPPGVGVADGADAVGVCLAAHNRVIRRLREALDAAEAELAEIVDVVHQSQPGYGQPGWKVPNPFRPNP